MDLNVENVMIREVITVESDFSVKYAARMMSLLRISSLVVVAEDRVAGILTERDLVSRVLARGLDPEKVLIKEVMSLPVIVTRPSFPLDKAVAVMLTKNIKKLPVMGGSNNETLVGIISLTDVAKLHPIIYSSMKEQAQAGLSDPREEVDFYIC